MNGALKCTSCLQGSRSMGPARIPCRAHALEDGGRSTCQSQHHEDFQRFRRKGQQHGKVSKAFFLPLRVKACMSRHRLGSQICGLRFCDKRPATFARRWACRVCHSPCCIRSGFMRRSEAGCRCYRRALYSLCRSTSSCWSRRGFANIGLQATLSDKSQQFRERYVLWLLHELRPRGSFTTACPVQLSKTAAGLNRRQRQILGLSWDGLVGGLRIVDQLTYRGGNQDIY